MPLPSAPVHLECRVPFRSEPEPRVMEPRLFARLRAVVLDPGVPEPREDRMLVDEIKAQMFKAMKANSVVEKEILRVAVGEITTEAARPGRQGSDEEAVAIIRKLIKSNEESLLHLTDEPHRAKLKEEIDVLAAFLPKSLSEDDIVSALAPVAEQIRSASNDGQATGVAMKHLKAAGAAITGKDVAAAVKRLRSSG